MKIFIIRTNKNLEIKSFENLNNISEDLKKYATVKCHLEAKIFVINESISSHKLSKFKNNFDELNIYSLSIYSNIRDTIVAGKSLKIDSKFLKEEDIYHKLFFYDMKNKDDSIYVGTVRSGDRITSDGNLCIIGDVNPGAIVSAKKNIYVWGKLLGIAFAGKDGEKNSSIASLYLNPLQLRIAEVVAIGPKEKPKKYYPEIAVIDEQTINIKPYLIEIRN